MYQFDKIKMDILNGYKLVKPLEYGYRLKLDSKKTLMEYHKKFHSKLIKQGMDSHLQRIKNNENREYPIEGHWFNNPSIVIEQICLMEAISGNEISLLKALVMYEASLLKPKLEALQRGDILYLNQEGSFFCFGDGLIIENTIKSPKLIFPKNNAIEIIKWPNGVHYYAKVDGKDVVVNGIGKWKTSSAAKRNAEKFLMELETKK